MKIRVKGVLIELTKEQIDRIESELKDLEANTNTWIKLLTHFGFKKVNTKGWADPDQVCYSNNEKGYFVNINVGLHETYIGFHGSPIDDGHPWGKTFVCISELRSALLDAESNTE